MTDILCAAPWWAWLAVGLVIGFVLGALCLDRTHHDGVIHVTRAEDHDRYLFEFNIPPEKIPTMKSVIFQVRLSKDDFIRDEGLS